MLIISTEQILLRIEIDSGSLGPFRRASHSLTGIISPWPIILLLRHGRAVIWNFYCFTFLYYLTERYRVTIGFCLIFTYNFACLQYIKTHSYTRRYLVCKREKCKRRTVDYTVFVQRFSVTFPPISLLSRVSFTIT